MRATRHPLAARRGTRPAGRSGWRRRAPARAIMPAGAAPRAPRPARGRRPPRSAGRTPHPAAGPPRSGCGPSAGRAPGGAARRRRRPRGRSPGSTSSMSGCSHTAMSKMPSPQRQATTLYPFCSSCAVWAVAPLPSASTSPTTGRITGSTGPFARRSPGDRGRGVEEAGDRGEQVVDQEGLGEDRAADAPPASSPTRA